MSTVVNRRQRGFTLIEGLISLVVLSVGMLGIAGLYVQALESSQGALLRTKAILFAEDMADRMRANRGGAPFYATDGPALNGCDDFGGNAANPCTPQQMAQNDLYRWTTNRVASAETGLPGGIGEITVNNATTPPTYTITVRWTDRADSYAYQVEIQL
jgi:type IV pilus assembly protein PilV